MSSTNLLALRAFRMLERDQYELDINTISENLKVLGQTPTVTKEDIERATFAAKKELEERKILEKTLSKLKTNCIELKRELSRRDPDTQDASETGFEAVRLRGQDHFRGCNGDKTEPITRWAFLAKVYPDVLVYASKDGSAMVTLSASKGPKFQFAISQSGEVLAPLPEHALVLQNVWSFPDEGPRFQWVQAPVPVAYRALLRRYEGLQCLNDLVAKGTLKQLPPESYPRGVPSAYALYSTAVRGDWFCLLTVPPEYPHRPSCASLCHEDPTTASLTIRKSSKDANALMVCVDGAPISWGSDELSLMEYLNAVIVAESGEECPGGVDAYMVQRQVAYFLAKEPRPESVSSGGTMEFLPCLVMPTTRMIFNSKLCMYERDPKRQRDTA